MFHVRVTWNTFLLRSRLICIRMEFHFRMYGVSRRMCYVRVTYVWRMKCTRDVSTAYVRYVLFLSAAHLLCTINFAF